MRIRKVYLLAILGGACFGILLAGVAYFLHNPGPVYSVGQVKAGIAHDPRHWMGRRIRILAIDTGGIVASITYNQPGIPLHGLIDPHDNMFGANNGLMVWAKAFPIEFSVSPHANSTSLTVRFEQLLRLLGSPQVLDVSHAKVYTVRIAVQKPCLVEQLSTSCVVGDLGRISEHISY